jgi:hypothetical protein
VNEWNAATCGLGGRAIAPTVVAAPRDLGAVKNSESHGGGKDQNALLPHRLAAHATADYNALMTVEQLKALHEARPFRPFTIHLADGTTVPVRHPEFLWRTPGGRTVFVSRGDEDITIIDLVLVTKLVAGNGRAKPRR